ncbi:MAG: hypothetical protein IH864_01805, partial [Chloroflexi bacterium]|nr:hypothetical protein [Chloroflexota bacterium]
MIGARRLPIPGITALIIISALLLFVAAQDAMAGPPPFSPKGLACLENFADDPGGLHGTLPASSCNGDSSPGAVTDIRAAFCVGKTLAGSLCENGGAKDSNFGGIVAFTPPDWFVASASDMPIGAVVARLTSRVVLGLLNQRCNLAIDVAFTLMNASVDINDTIAPLPANTTKKEGVMTPLAADTNNNGVFDGIDKYPSFLNHPDTFQNITPIARLGGFSLIQGNWISLQFVIFDKTGLDLPSSNLPPELLPFHPNLGYPSITILNDPTAPFNPSPITDFCSPLDSGTVIFGDSRNNPCTPPQNPILPGCPAGPQLGRSATLGAPFFPCDNNLNDDGIEGLSDDDKVNDGCPQVNQIAESGAECDNNISDDGDDSTVNDGCPQVGSYSETGFIPDPDGCDTDTNEASCAVRQNPSAAGTYNFVVFAASQRDFDGDGIENPLDVCWKDPNPEWDPRAQDTTNDP